VLPFLPQFTFRAQSTCCSCRTRGSARASRSARPQASPSPTCGAAEARTALDPAAPDVLLPVCRRCCATTERQRLPGRWRLCRRGSSWSISPTATWGSPLKVRTRSHHHTRPSAPPDGCSQASSLPSSRRVCTRCFERSERCTFKSCGWAAIRSRCAGHRARGPRPNAPRWAVQTGALRHAIRTLQSNASLTALDLRGGPASAELLLELASFTAAHGALATLGLPSIGAASLARAASCLPVTAPRRARRGGQATNGGRTGRRVSEQPSTARGSPR
jgi:hypothetical protein